MPEGSAEQDYQPYTEDPQNLAGDFDNAQTENTENEPDDQGQRYAPGSIADRERQNNPAYSGQLDENQQADAALFIGMDRQRRLRQIQQQINEMEKDLRSLETSLNDFKKSTLGGLSSIFQPRIRIIIDALIEELKREARNLSDEQKVAYYTGLVTLASSLISILTALKMAAAILDAITNWVKQAAPSCVTVIGFIFFVIIAPLYITFLAVVFMIGVIPLLKGRLTKIDNELIKDLKKYRDIWQAELDKAKNKVTLRKQIKQLKKAAKRI